LAVFLHDTGDCGSMESVLFVSSYDRLRGINEAICACMYSVRVELMSSDDERRFYDAIRAGTAFN